MDFFLIFCAVLLAISIAAMARTVGMRWCVSVLAGVLFPLMTLPLGGPYPFAAHFYIVSPTSYYSTAGTVFVTALFWRIDNRSWIRFAILTGSIVIILLHLSMTLVFFMVILAPAIMVFGIAALVASKSRGELLAKLTSAAIIAVALAAAGIFHYLYAIGSNTSYHVFYNELRDFMLYSAPNWSNILNDLGQVFYFNLDFQIKYEGVLSPLSQLGAIYLAIFGDTREARIFGRTMLVWIFATAAIIPFLHFFYYFTGHEYAGPAPPHFVPILWPYYSICLASLSFAFVEGVLWLLSFAWPATRRISRLVPGGLVLVALVGALVYVETRARLHPYPYPFVTYRHKTPIVEYLERETSIAMDRDFRGTVVAMPTSYDEDTKPYYAGYRDRSFAYATVYLGNDMGQYGLWEYNIPTLNQFTENITPQFHLTVRELLSRPGIDAHQKHHTLITRLNQPIMELLGLRYIIADYELSIGAQRLEMPFSDDVQRVFANVLGYKSPLRLYELSHPNVGNYSPSNVVHAATAKAIISAMREPGFDGRQTIVTDNTDIKGGFVPATEAAMTVRMGGIAIRASSAGESLLVLPVQYSHCWQIVSGSKATLFRANLMQLGIRFYGNLQVELRQIFGPFWQSGCRITDVEDAERLDMVGAGKRDSGTVTIVPPGSSPPDNLVPGDGKNLIPNSEALEGFFSGPSTQLSKVATDAKASQVYRLTAAGRHGQHYTTSSPISLSPGNYTLSIEVRPERVRQVRLWLNDLNSTGGPIADIDLINGNIKVVRPDVSGGIRAGFQLIADGWYKIWISGRVTAANSSITLWLSNEVGSFDFALGEEALFLRALQLERGDTASSYDPATASGPRT
jgi:hypothetical protein